MARDPTLTALPVGKPLKVSIEDGEIQENVLQNFCGEAVAEFGVQRDALSKLLKDSVGKRLSQRVVEEALWRVNTMAWAFGQVWSNASMTPPLLEAAKQVNKGTRSTQGNPKHEYGRKVRDEWMKWMDEGQPPTKHYPHGLPSEFAKHWEKTDLLSRGSIQENISGRWKRHRADVLRKRAQKGTP